MHRHVETEVLVLLGDPDAHDGVEDLEEGERDCEREHDRDRIRERLLAEQGEKVEAGEREKIESALKALKDSLAGADIEAVKQAHEALVGASQEFAQRLYAAASAQQQGAPGGAQAPSDDEVAEAEIVDEDNA